MVMSAKAELVLKGGDKGDKGEVEAIMSRDVVGAWLQSLHQESANLSQSRRESLQGGP